MNIVILIICAILPIFLILYYTYKKDKEKEPIILLITFFVLGLLSVYIVLGLSKIIEFIFPTIYQINQGTSFIKILLYTFIGIGLIEEFSKWIMVYALGYNNKEFDELYDMIIYAVFVSLGFAFFENIIYVLDSREIKIALVRALFALPAHACNGVFMGYHLSLAKYSEEKIKKKNYKEIIISILIPTILHGIYDFCLLAKNRLFLYVFFIFTINLTIISILKINQISRSKKKIKPLSQE